ncbi:hypothetical protein Droror1_Dr00011377 [Drosera rotundifolia]
MSTTADRVHMPANNQVQSSAALQTHGIWQITIKYDPYAPNKDDDGSSSQGLLDVLRDRAFEVLAEDLTQSCNFLRRSVGVYSYLVSAILPPLLPKLSADKPPEVFAATCTAWSLICLAEAQDYISTSRSLHELQSFKCMAQDANLADQLGLSLGLLRKAKSADKKAPKDYGGRHQD